MPAARFHTYSETHELELSDLTWRCRWCHAKAKDLRMECTGYKPPPKKASSSRSRPAEQYAVHKDAASGAVEKLAAFPHADQGNMDQVLH